MTDAGERRGRARRRRAEGPTLTVVWWRGVPAQVIVDLGDLAAKREMPDRFHEAIDAAAMRGGARDDAAYLDGWRRDVSPLDPDRLDPTLPRNVAAALAADVEIQRLDAAYDASRLRALIEAGGTDSGDPEAT